MNFYKRHLGDYATAAGHLTMLEHGAYTLLLDRYYSSEGPIPVPEAFRVARARTREEREATEAVLREFFVVDGDVYRNRRADEEIERANHQRTVNQAIGKRGGRPRKTDSTTEPETDSETDSVSGKEPNRNPSQTPDSISQESRAEKLSSSAAPNDPPQPLDLHSARQERLAQVTADAIETFNGSGLVKAGGGFLACVSAKVGREKRQQQVRSSLRTLRAMCEEITGSPMITREFFVLLWEEVGKDDFLSGRARGGQGHENWLPDFEFLIREKTLIKLFDKATTEDAA